MKRRILVGLVLGMMVFATMTVSAQQNIFVSYNKTGHMNVYATVGWGGGYWLLGAAVSAEFVIGQFSLGPVPFDWGIMASGVMNFLPGFGIGADAMATLHLGLIWNLDFYAGLGLGVGILPFDIGLAQTVGVVYKLSDTLYLQGQEIWNSNGPGVYGVGIVLKL